MLEPETTRLFKKPRLDVKAIHAEAKRVQKADIKNADSPAQQGKTIEFATRSVAALICAARQAHESAETYATNVEPWSDFYDKTHRKVFGAFRHARGLSVASYAVGTCGVLPFQEQTRIVSAYHRWKGLGIAIWCPEIYDGDDGWHFDVRKLDKCDEGSFVQFIYASEIVKQLAEREILENWSDAIHGLLPLDLE